MGRQSAAFAITVSSPPVQTGVRPAPFLPWVTGLFYSRCPMDIIELGFMVQGVMILALLVYVAFDDEPLDMPVR